MSLSESDKKYGKRWKQTPYTKRWIKKSGNSAKLNEVLDVPNCTFLGGLSDQPFTAFYIWERFFLRYGPEMKRFIEFGVDQGNTACYFALQCLNHEAEYIGFDHRRKQTYQNTPVKKMLRLWKKIRYGNGYKRLDEVQKLIQEKGMTVIFTDMVDKPLEFDSFAPMLKRGDVLAVHDWDRAIKDEWVETTLNLIRPFTLLYEDERIGINTLTRFFRKE